MGHRLWTVQRSVLGILVVGLARGAAAQQVAQAPDSVVPHARVDSAESPVRDSAARDTELERLRQRVDELDQRVRVLDRLRELERDSLKTAAKTAPKLSAGKQGFAMRSADSTFQLKLRGYIQTDGRFFGGDQRPVTNTLLLRRVRPIFEATAWKNLDLRLMPDFGQGQTVLYDAYLDLHLNPALSLRAGKQKPPIGLERWQSAQDIVFVERGLPTNLVPSRDIGVQLYGDLLGSTIQYVGGVYNGAPDLAVNDADNGSNKDAVGRIFLQPFVKGGPKSLSGLGLGFAASQGIQRGSITSTFLPSYRSPGQQTIFSYLAGTTADATVIAGGDHTRLSPQGYFYVGPFGLLGEYVTSAQKVRRGGAVARLNHHAWQVASSWVLTGEKESFKGVTPKHPFEPGGEPGTHGAGAFEIGVRYGQLLFDPDAFPLFANPSTSVRREKSWGLAANWYLARGIRLMLDYDETHYVGGAATGNRPSEKAILSRIQYSF
jgi:phosphate-selective porin OprO and OprP